MKVKIADLKTNLSRYLRSLSRSGEVIEVCVREKTVAYLSPVVEAAGGERTAWNENLARSGLRVQQWGQAAVLPLEPPLPAEDGRVLENSVVSLRKGRDW